MTPLTRPSTPDRRPARGAAVAVAHVQARLPGRAAAAGAVVRPGAAHCAARRAAGAVAQAPGRRRRSTAIARRIADRRHRPRRVGHGHLVPARAARTACSAASATAWPSPSSRTWPGCRRRCRPSSTTSDPSTSTGWRCCATRCSPSTTCSCRCSPRSAGCCGSASRVVLLASIHPALVLLAARRRARPCSPPRGGPASSARVEEAARRRPPGPPPVRARHHRVARQGGARHRHRRVARRPNDAPRGTLVRAGRRARAGPPRSGTRRPGRCSAPATSAHRVRRLRARRVGRRRCCWCWRPAPGCRSTSARPSASSASCAASGSTRRAGSPGSRTTPPSLDAGRRAGARPARRRHPLRARVVPYPGTDRLVLDDVDAAPAGRHGGGRRRRERRGQDDAGEAAVPACTAHVGPHHRRRRRPRRDRRPTAWRARLAGAFQDFFRFELPARETVGRGRPAPARRRPAVEAAVGRAGADDVVDRLAHGLDTQLGPTWDEGRRGVASASGRSWRWPAASCATIRWCWCSTSRPRRSTPRPSTPCSSATPRGPRRAPGDGRITVLVSHRFSTVRMADLIVVMDGARVVEVGTHDELLAAGGTYAELYASRPTPTAERASPTAEHLQLDTCIGCHVPGRPITSSAKGSIPNHVVVIRPSGPARGPATLRAGRDLRPVPLRPKDTTHEVPLLHQRHARHDRAIRNRDRLLPAMPRRLARSWRTGQDHRQAAPSSQTHAFAIGHAVGHRTTRRTKAAHRTSRLGRRR